MVPWFGPQMDTLIKIVIISTLVLGGQNEQIKSTLSLPALDAWWGPEETKYNNDTSIRPFEINITEEEVSFSSSHTLRILRVLIKNDSMAQFLTKLGFQ